MKRAVVASTLLLTATATPAPAAAFVRTMTCTTSGVYACRAGEIARPVRWPTRCVTYYINQAGSSDIRADADGLIGDALVETIRLSFDAWTAVAQADMNLEYAGLTNEDRAEYDGGRGPDGNANIIVFRDDRWPYASTEALALTSVTYDPSNGLIADADIELNSAFNVFTIGEQNVRVDVRNTLTHEVGHFIGLDHTPIEDATMYHKAPSGETQKRTLHADDVAGIVDIYPPLDTDQICDVAPDFFERPDPVDDDEGCCATVASGRTGSAALLSFAALIALGKRRRRLAR